MQRHTCIICGSKRNEIYMTKVFMHSWACKKPKYYFSSCCYEHPEIKEAIEVIKIISNWKKINLSYLGTISTVSSNVIPELTLPRDNND